MPTVRGASIGYMFEYQPPATLNQAAPVQNTWYTILDTTEYVRVYLVSVNVEDVNETLEVQFTIDGETLAADSLACTHSTPYVAILWPHSINRIDEVRLATQAETTMRRAFLIEGHSVKIEVRKTTIAGAGNLTGIVMYGVLTACSP